MQIPVLIVGGGPSGLATSILLSSFGIRSLLIDRREQPSHQPWASGVSTRTMELFAAWGIDEAVRARALDVHLVGSVSDTLASSERARSSLGYPDADAARAVSPVAPIVIPRDELEPILLDSARRSPHAELRFGTSFVHLDQQADGVDVTLHERASGRATHVRARYVVGADGVWSPTRRAAGIDVRGVERQGEYCRILFRADLDSLVGRRRCALYLVQTPHGPGAFVPTSRDGRWVLVFPWPDDEPLEWPAHHRLASLVRSAVGVSDLPLTILDVGTCSFSAAVAERFRDRNVFLVGDAAHRMTPSGGMGLNTAIHDAHNLAWKLAAVLRGWAREPLLDSYQAERRPVAERNVARSLGKHPELSGLAVDLGVVYATDEGQGAATFADVSDDATHSARVGARAPHVWLESGWGPISTLDLFGDGMVVLTSSEEWRTTAMACGKALGVPLAAYVIDGDGGLSDPSLRWADVFGVGDVGAVLVRPDGIVAWRTTAAADASAKDFRRAMNRLLGRRISDGRPSGELQKDAAA